MRIENCPLEFQCDKSWRSLKRTEDKDIRHCISCGEDVHLCRTEEDFESAQGAGKCVALRPLNREPVVMGWPKGRGPWQGGG